MHAKPAIPLNSLRAELSTMTSLKSEPSDSPSVKSILIVDDDPDARFLLESILEGQGYRLQVAENAEEAIETAVRALPDVILLDVVMPKMDGFEVCRMIRSLPAIAEVPILMLTSLGEKSNVLKGFESGADDYIVKPYDCFELCARLATILRLNRYRKLCKGRAELEAAHAELIEAYDATLEGWTEALDLRDKETEGHARRVTVLTETLACASGLGTDELAHVRRGALLHDIGKLGVPDSILHKPGKLTEQEWEVMRQHPQFAYDMLHPIEYLRPALDIPYCHHEKWDGTGYPRGLKGEQIPLSARLFAVVDVWDALTSDRTYRKAWSPAETLDYIRAQKGTHFDPNVVELFCRLVEEKNLIPHP